jgi:mono/diheme cytochrome c family protein
MESIAIAGAAVALAAGVGGCKEDYDKILALEGDAVKGQILYENNCASCHGMEGEGISGPSLVEWVPQLTGTEILQTIVEGPGEMTEFGDYFDDQQLADILEYLTQEFQ